MKNILFALFLLGTFIQYGYPQNNQISIDSVPAQVVDYVTKKYPKADSIKYFKGIYTDPAWAYKDKYIITFKEKEQAISLKLVENGSLVSLTKEIPTEKIPAFAHKYIEKHYKNATILKAERKYLYIDSKIVYDENTSQRVFQKSILKSPAEKYYCIFISYEAINVNTGEFYIRKVWVDFNKKKQYIGRVNEI